MKVTINVTENHIKRGKPKDSSCCAITLAARPLIKLLYRTYIGTSVCGVTIDNKCFKLPIEAKEFMRKFDINKKLVRPTKFQVDISDELLVDSVLTKGKK